MSELAAPLPHDRSTGRSLFALLAPIVAIVLCVVLTAILLAALPAARGEADRTFTQSLALIGKTIWRRVLLPRSPAATAGYRNWILTLQSTTPILLTGLAVTAAFRANVLNIGAQGQYVLGAIAATAVGVYIPLPAPLLIPLHLLAAMLAGALLAAIAGALEQWRKVPVVLSTLLLNFIALESLRYLLQGPMRAHQAEGGFQVSQSEELAEAARLPEYFSINQGQGIHIGFFLALAAAIVLAFILWRTTFGFRLRVVGENPTAARFAGISVARVLFASLALSGALAGLAGAVQIAGRAPYVLQTDIGMDGIGFTGIAVALLGRLSPIGVVFSALFLGLLTTAFSALEQSMQIHSVTAQAVEGALVIAVLIVTSPRWAKMLAKLKPAAIAATSIP
jgi:ABC-type uncharacterized transport system permease subunit